MKGDPRAPASLGATLAAFLRAELAPTPGRTRAALRVLIASLVGTVIVMATHAPHGHWIIITIFLVSPEDAGSSLIKGIQRLVGTVAGGAVGVLIVIAFANEPWFMFAAIGVAVAVGMFLSRTTSAPYASLLGTVTLLLVVFSHLDSPGAEIDTALWRTLMILLGVLLGTGAQILLWPSDPEERLLDDLVVRLSTVERLLAEVLAPPRGGVADVPGPDVMAISGFARELDLLANAEARYPALRRRHPEQIALITEVERLLTNALWLSELTQSPEGQPRLDDSLRRRLGTIREECGRQRQALAARQPAASEVVSGQASRIDVAPEVGIPALVAYMEATLIRIATATQFLGSSAPARGLRAPASTSPLDTLRRAPFLTPSFSLSNTGDIVFALKCAVAVEICLLIILGLDWPGLMTSIVTCVIGAQSSLGASIYKAFLRLAGAVLGGLLGLAMIVAVMPNAEGLAWMLLPFAAGVWIAAWIAAGSSRISYAGVQVGMALAIAVVDVIGPTVDLVPPRDRVLGIVLGIVVLTLVYEAVWPLRASRAMRPALGSALRAMAVLAVVEPAGGGYEAAVARAARHRSSVYHGLADVLRLREESTMEPGASAPAARAERDTILRLTADAQAVFLALLALARHRVAIDRTSAPATVAAHTDHFDRDVRQAIETIAGNLEGKKGPRPDLQARFDELERAGADWRAPAVMVTASALAYLRGEIAVRRDVMAEVLRLSRAVDA